MEHNTTKELIADKYELISVAGEGGMATVWRALMHGAAGFSRPVAVKHILQNLANNENFVAMFIEEARVGSQLIYPNIVQIFDFVKDNRGAYYLVMEWIEGMDLGSYAAAFERIGQPTSWPLITGVVVEALRGLSAAHTRIDSEGNPAPVIHRDVTPQNILIGANGIVKLSDFGLARAMDRARMTQPDIIKGKLGYHAPEIAFGRPASPQSDLYSLGIVLWESLAGQRLYAGTSDAEIFFQSRQAEVPPLRERRRDLPDELCEAVHHALEREPERRFESAREMIRALTRILRDVSKSTDCYAVSQSVIETRRLLREP
jgi:serine/threonine-protein kinase